MSEQPAPSNRGSVEEIFHVARSLAAPQREEFLLRACGNDAKLRRRVEALLRASESGENFLPEQPGVHAAGQRTNLTAVITERPGDCIGNYELLEQIGVGGFGVVFKAKQLVPIQRVVALKIIKLGMDTMEVMARFEAERQTLAAMDHPNIAKVFDAGATETGRPFFVMEFVEGISLTAYADQNRLTTRARLDLFTAVCRAVQHAHTKGIIHRDLKPSNVLVTVQDGEAVPKLIDFGIAKATAQSVGFHTVATALGVLGTPAYMSPEQANLQRPDIDTRSDVYSLGVLLYELLTGQPPFEPSEMLRLALDEVLKTIREREPPPPSARLENLARQKLTESALNRQIEPARLKHLLRGDLDCIVMKCLEKDRTRRYQSASDLALDVRRHLANKPIAASPPDIFYRGKKFARRHRLALATSAGIFLAALGGWIFWQLQPGTVLLEFEPASAQLEIDGQPRAVGKMPAQLKLSAGVHQLRFYKPEFTNELRTVAVPRGGTVSVPHLVLKHFQGTLDVDSTRPGTGIEFAGVDYFEGIHEHSADTGDYDLIGFADECYEVHHHVSIARDQVTTDRVSLENGVVWKVGSAEVQSDCAVITNVPPGQPPVIVENMIGAVGFFSAADGALLDRHPITFGTFRYLARLDLGGTAGQIIVTGADSEDGPVLTAFADAWPKKLLWEWHGATVHFDQPSSISITAVAHAGGGFRIAVAGRGGRVFFLDEKGRSAGQAIVSESPSFPQIGFLAAWNQSGRNYLLTYCWVEKDHVYRGMLLDADRESVLWDKSFGGSGRAPFALPDARGVPSIVVCGTNECRIFSAETGELRSRVALPGRAKFPWPAEAEGTGQTDLVLGFADPALPMLAVRPADGAILWRGPTNLFSEQRDAVNKGTLCRNQFRSSSALLVMLNDGLAAVDVATGKIAWQVPAKPEDLLLDDAGDNIYLTTRDRRLFCVNSSGGVNWILRLHDELSPTAIIPGGDQSGRRDVLLQSRAKLMTLVHWPSLLWSLPTTAAFEAAPLVVTNASHEIAVIQLLPGQIDSALSRLDVASGRTLWADSEFHLAPNRPPTVADLDGDGTNVVVALAEADTTSKSKLLVWRVADGKLIRAPDVDLKHWLSCTPAAADFRGIGKSDVAASSWVDQRIVLLDGRTGKTLWQQKTAGQNMGGLTAADLDQDGLPDVVAASGDGHVYALRGKDGKLFWQSPGTNCASFSRPVVADLNGDGKLQVLVTTLDGKLVVLDGKTGDLLWSPALSGHWSIAGQATVASVNGKKIILAPLGTNGAVAFDWQRRQELWRSPAGNPVIATPVVADLAHDGSRQVILGTTRGEVIVLRLDDGAVLWRQKIAAQLIVADPVVADLNHDGTDDLLIASEDFVLYAIDGRTIVSTWRKP
jgi:serine/threonine protein kinase/outer membrane protein assembly factor BamB